LCAASIRALRCRRAPCPELVHIPRAGRRGIEWIENAPLYRCAASCCRWSFLTVADARRRAKMAAETGQLHRRTGRRRPPLGLVGGRAGRSGGDFLKPLSRSAENFGLFPGNRAGQRRAGADSRSGIDRLEGRGEYARRKILPAVNEATPMRAPSPPSNIAGGSSRPPGRGAVGRRAAHRTASRQAHRVHRLPAGAQLRGATAAGGGLGRPCWRGRGQSQRRLSWWCLREGNRHVGHCRFACLMWPPAGTCSRLAQRSAQRRDAA